jgi:Mlc titration factor MtfA (ptsG expression regulator)
MPDTPPKPSLLSALRRFFSPRSRALSRPFPEVWREILKTNVPLCQRLDPRQIERLEKLIQAFIVDIPFEGCGGLRIDDEMRVTIAGQACLLVLESDRPTFPILRSILVYPSAYKAPERGPSGAFEGEAKARLGESWGEGYVVLAWDAVLHGAVDMSDGQNVVLHEFAHQIDQEDGVADGVPILDHPQRYGNWTKVLDRDFEAFEERLSRRKKTVLDPYGATNKAEFFAVATETFFEKPRALKKRYPELYEMLRELYGLDPVAS